MQFLAFPETGGQKHVQADKLPDKCPLCHKSVTPNFGQAYLKTSVFDDTGLQVIFRCPNDKCNDIFIGYYSGNGSNYTYRNSKPSSILPPSFTSMVSSTFPIFVEIYGQAHEAEQIGLNFICGAGYRKALEFLVKDYLITQSPEYSEAIKKEFLGAVIEKRVSHEQLKAVAKRAAWLGNDESHYERKWEDKDVTDLKKTIELAVRWIETEKLTKDLLTDMPETGSSVITQ